MMTPKNKFMLFNAGAGLLILFGAAAIVKSELLPDDVARCSLRYATGTEMILANSSGNPLSSGALQGSFSIGEWGITDNLSIKRGGLTADAMAMRIAVSKAADSYLRTGANNDGVGFEWRPGYVEDGSAACLSYNLRLPDKFNRALGGVLPGLFGAAEADTATQNDRFAMRFRWGEKSLSGLRIERTTVASDDAGRGGKTERLDVRPFKLPTGRWIALEQEVILNAPGKSDGVLRVWLDGDLVYEDEAMTYRSSDATRIQGVVGDTHYNRRGKNLIGAKEQAILMTAFELSW